MTRLKNYGSLLELLLIFICVACQASSPGGEQQGESPMAMMVLSSAFSDSDEIPTKYSCDSENLSPPISWSGTPDGTLSLVMISDDPDAPAGTFTHWVLFNISPETTSLPEGVSNIGTQGVNSFGRSGYSGPCPPKGSQHRYFFKLYALDTMLDLPPGATKSGVEKAMQGNVLAQGQLMGVYKR